MVIDHICFAVKDVNEAISYWQNVFGYRQQTEIVTNTRQRVNVVFLVKEDSVTVKLIEPLDDNSALIDAVRRGGGFHHLCFQCDDIDIEMAELRAKGLRTLVPPQPGEAFGNHEIAFMRARYGLNFELIDTDERAGLL
ncbi:MAG: VOC family protein [Mycobacterium sp.]|nr:VOC family protein [Mycobacterium sp.]